MRKKCSPLLIVSFSIALFCAPMTMADQYGVFLIDQSESMSIPAHSPRLERATTRALEDIRSFVDRADASGTEAFFKIASFGGASGYVEHTGWIEDLDEARERLAALRPQKNRQPSTLLSPLCAARNDLLTQARSRADRNLYLYTDGERIRRPTKCLYGKDLSTANRLGISNEELGKTVNWRMVFFEGTGDSMIRAQMADPSIGKFALANQRRSEATRDLLLNVARESNGLLYRISDPDFTEGSPVQKSTTTVSKYQYFSVGKTTKKIKRNISSNAIFWLPGDLGNGAKTRKGVSAVRMNGRTYVFHLGETNDSIYYSYSTNGVNWQGNAHVTTLKTRSAPKAIVADDKIRVYFTHDVPIADNFPHPVWSIESLSINSSTGAIVWGNLSNTGLQVSGAEATTRGFYDPVNNKEVLRLWNPTSGLYELLESSPGQNNWTVRHIFDNYYPIGASFLNVGNDTYMIYTAPVGSLRLAKESDDWDAQAIPSNATYHLPAIGLAEKLVTVYVKAGDDDIMVTRSDDLGATWYPPLQGTELTYDNIAMVAWTETLPLTCGISSGPYFGDTGSPLIWTAHATGGDSPYSYTWRIDGWVAGTGSSLTHTFLSSGTYSLQLTVTDSASDTCTTYRYITIDSTECQDPFMPCIEQP